MATAANIKRKNIDLPLDVIRKLGVMAMGQGLSLKKYIESIVIREASGIQVTITANPSPTGDPWWDDPRNVAEVESGLREVREGQGTEYSIDGLKELMGL